MPLVLQVIQDQPDRREQLVHKDRLDLQVILEAQALRALQAQLGLKELLAQLDQLAALEPPELLAHRDQPDQQEPQAQQD